MSDDEIKKRDAHILWMIESFSRPIYEGTWSEGPIKSSLLVALWACLELREAPIPRWVAVASRQAIDDFFGSRVRTLEEAFSVVEKRHKNLEADRKKNQIMPHIVGFVQALQAEGHSLEEAFDMAAKKWNISTSSARDTYYYPQLKLEQRLAKCLEELDPILTMICGPKKNKDAET